MNLEEYSKLLMKIFFYKCFGHLNKIFILKSFQLQVTSTLAAN